MAQGIGRFGKTLLCLVYEVFVRLLGFQSFQWKF